MGIKIYHISRGHCAGCSRGREVGVVSCGCLASTIFRTHNGLDRWTSGLFCWGVLWEQSFCDSDAESVPYTLRARSKCPCDFFLWGYLKEKVFKHRPWSLEDLKERIQQKIDSIPPELTRRVMKYFRERLQQCVATTAAICLILFLKPIKNCFYVFFRNIFNFFLDSFFHFLYLFEMWEIFMPHPVHPFLQIESGNAVYDVAARQSTSSTPRNPKCKTEMGNECKSDIVLVLTWLCTGAHTDPAVSEALSPLASTSELHHLRGEHALSSGQLRAHCWPSPLLYTPFRRPLE